MLESIFKTATFRQSQITVIGTLINGLLGFGFYVFLARIFGPSDFGLFTVATTTMVLIADIADIGTNTGLIRFVSKNLAVGVERAYGFLKLSLEIKFIAWIISSLLVILSAPFLAKVVFHKESLILPLQLAGFGVGGALFFTFATSSLQAYQKYFLWSLVNILTNGLRLVLILILSYLLILNLESSIIMYFTLPFFGFFVTLFLLPIRKIFQASNEFSLAKELFKYNIPVAIFTIIAAFSAKLDTYLTAALLSSREVGIYGAANQLVSFLPQLVSALGLVASPKFASFQNIKQMLVYFKKFQFLVSGMVILGIITIPVFNFLIPYILGAQYKEAVLPFIILFLAQLIFLFSIPVHHSIIFYYGKPDVFIWVSIGHLILIATLGYLMISNYGVVGVALTVLAGTAFNFLYPLIWLVLKLRR